MAPYTYNNYYDAAGSQANRQPQGYTYAQPQQQQQAQQQQQSSSLQYGNQSGSNYASNYQQGYTNTYPSQQYATTSRQQQPAQSSSSSNRPSSDLNNQTYGQSSSDSRSNNVANQYDSSSYYASAGFSALNDRSQANNSPLYATNISGSTFGRLSLPDQSQSSSNNTASFVNTQTYQATPSDASTRRYQNAPSSASRGLGSYYSADAQPQSQQQPPQRYASPLSAVQAQQANHAKQSSRSSNTHVSSPQVTARNMQHQSQRQHSASVEPSPTTVDPSQVYDMRAEQQRKAQIDAEKRRKFEVARKAEEEARKAEEAAHEAKEDTKAEAERKKLEAEEAAKRAEEDAKKKVAQERKNEQRRKAREEKRQSKTAATALTQMASSSGGPGMAGMEAMAALMGDMSNPPANDEEVEMRAMFKKMREFNARNPAMLAKLWEEERTQHAAQSSSPTPAKAAPAASPPKQQSKQPAATAPTLTATPNAQQHYRPKPTPATQAPPQPVQQQASTALWPSHKKGSLAEAAAIWLNNLPENSSFGRSIDKDAVLKILDTNPSYVQLCESIEKTQIRFERSALAKELLKAVPDGLRNTQAGAKPSTPSTPALATATATSQVGSSSSTAGGAKKKGGRPKKDGPLKYGIPTQSRGSHAGTTVSYSTPTFHSLTNAARAVNNMTTSSAFPESMSMASAITANTPGQQLVQSPYPNQPITIDDDGPMQLEVKDETPVQPEEPPRPPADKEEAARKRTFGDLVDLTKGDDSDDDGPPRKIQQLGGPVNFAMDYPPTNDTFRKPMDFGAYMRPNIPNTIPNQGPTHFSAPLRAPIQCVPPPLKPSIPVVPSQPQIKPKGPTEEQKQQERMRGKMLVEPIMRDRVARKSRYDSRTIARDVLLATGRHPDMRALNAHLNPMQKLLGDHGGVVDGAGNKSDLSTIRWDIIDPGTPDKDAKAKAKSVGAARDEEFGNTTSMEDEPVLDADDEAETRYTASLSRPLPRDLTEDRLQQMRNLATPDELLRFDDDEKLRKQILNRLRSREWRAAHPKSNDKSRVSDEVMGNRITSLEHLASDGDDSGNDTTLFVSGRQERGPGPSGKPRVGRPPKTRKAVASSSNNKNNAQSTPVHTPGPKQSPGSAVMSGSGAVGYAAFRTYDENGNVVKKKGRPVGWRKNVHSREAAGLPPATSHHSAKPAASQSRQSASKAEFVKPHYAVYKCQWRDCTAGLDNLERLKKHALKLHGIENEDKAYECLWQPCRFNGKHVDSDGKVRPGPEDVTSFESLEHWMKHINKEHLEPVAWKLGDGPKGGALSDHHTDSGAYLSDKNGRRVTPIIVPLSERVKADDGAILMSDLPQFNQTLENMSSRPEGRSKEIREAEAQLEKLRAKQQRQGVTMGREGSRLVNEKRRRGFIDDEDFEDFIEESD